AELMNRHYVNVKVDREDRPDIDDIYMAATLAMNQGQGGWPMTVFLTPDLEPVFAGTYYPPDDVPGRRGFRRLLRGIARAWDENREGVVGGAKEFADYVRRQRAPLESLAVGPQVLQTARDQLANDFDRVYGGFGGAPKFPPSTALSFLLRMNYSNDDAHALAMVLKTLDCMSSGGLYDHVGGGFARYSTDERWLVPHFEKMLYDNAQLSKIYLEAFEVTKDPRYERIARETLDYVMREMTDPAGGFYSSTDADSEGVEGKFFVWGLEELKSILPADVAELAAAYYDVTDSGNWEGTNILNTPHPIDVVADRLGLSVADATDILASARRTLYHARERRVPPHLDDKVITAWNGMMIGAFAKGFSTLGLPQYLEAARTAAAFIARSLATEKGLLRTYRAGKAHLNAYLEDYAYVADGLLNLYESCGETRHLVEALRLADTMMDRFGDEDSGDFFTTASDHERLLVRYREGADGATPAANAIAAEVLLRLGRHLDRSDLTERAARAIQAHGEAITRFPRAFTHSLSVVHSLTAPRIEVAVVGDPSNVIFEELRRVVGGTYLPHGIIALADGSETGQRDLPLLRDKTPASGIPAAYVCHDYACDAPVHSAEDLRELLTRPQPRGRISSS
ncbi:MAG: thioredoxin domain-containing protein, partial [Gemmatimonadales bacterium]